MNTFYSTQSDVDALTRVRSTDINTLDAAVDAAFDKLPAESDLKQGKVVYAEGAGTVNAYTVTLPYAPAAYADGMMVVFKPNVTNSGASTVNVNALGVKSIKALDGTPLVAGALVANGFAILIYNDDTGDFRVCNPATMFSSSSTYATLSGVETLYNKTLESPVLNNANINFTQDGAGAVAISITERAKQVVTVFDFMSTAQIADVRAGTIAQDVTTAIQAALDAAATKATTGLAQSFTTVVMPDGVYKITAQLVVPANVNLRCDGYLYNAIAIGTTMAIWFKAGSACERLTINANAKSGVLFGESATVNDVRIGTVRLIAVGEAAGQIACRFVGDKFSADEIHIEGGEYGIQFGDGSSVPANLVRISNARVYSASVGLGVSLGSEHNAIGHLEIDSCHFLGLFIDNCHDLCLPDVTIFFNDADAAFGSYTRDYAVEIGSFSGANHVTGLTLHAKVTNTASVDNVTGTALKLSNIDNSTIHLEANNATLVTGNGKRIVQCLEYGSGVGATVSVTGNFGTGLTPYTGTPAGTLAYNNGVAWTFYATPSDLKGDLRSIPQNIQNGAYNCVLSDAGKHMAKTDSTARAHTIQPNATVAYPIGTVLTFLNLGGTTNDLTVTRGGGVTLYRAGTNADIVVTPGDMVTCLKVGTDTWQA